MLGSGGVATEPALGTALARPTTALVATGHDWTCRQRDYEPVDGNRRWLAVAPLPSGTSKCSKESLGHRVLWLKRRL